MEARSLVFVPMLRTRECLVKVVWIALFFYLLLFVLRGTQFDGGKGRDFGHSTVQNGYF